MAVSSVFYLLIYGFFFCIEQILRFISFLADGGRFVIANNKQMGCDTLTIGEIKSSGRCPI